MQLWATLPGLLLVYDYLPPCHRAIFLLKSWLCFTVCFAVQSMVLMVTPIYNQYHAVFLTLFINYYCPRAINYSYVAVESTIGYYILHWYFWSTTLKQTACHKYLEHNFFVIFVLQARLQISCTTNLATSVVLRPGSRPRSTNSPG